MVVPAVLAHLVQEAVRVPLRTRDGEVGWRWWGGGRGVEVVGCGAVVGTLRCGLWGGAGAAPAMRVE